ncbi:MAG: beta-lactamase family protein [Flavobacteriaceae bacterium]|nr:beta-lactamase family protein [Flavobacteriaceae bacterium]
MRKYLFILLLAGVQSTLFSQQLAENKAEAVGMSSERLNTLSHTFHQYVKQGQLPGTVTLIARKGQVVYHEAIGMQDTENEIAMGTDAMFRIASQTKAIVSTAVMMLQERGQLLISDPISKYIPEFKNSTVAVKNEDDSYDVVPANREITIRDLLTHTAGIGYGYGVAADKWEEADLQGWYFAHRDEPVLETIKRIAVLPHDAQPGTQFVYGYNTDILGALVNVVSGQSLAEFLSEHILDPLGMNDTYFYLPKNKAKRLATVYNMVDQKLERAPKEGTMQSQGHYVKGPRKNYSGGAGLVSTAMDYAKFLQMMLNGGTYNNHRILSRKSVELMTVDHLGGIDYSWQNGMGFGLGYSISKDLGLRGELGSVGEFGWGGAYHSSYWVDPKEELVVVYFTQVIPIQNVDDHQKLRALVYQAIID